MSFLEVKLKILQMMHNGMTKEMLNSYVHSVVFLRPAPINDTFDHLKQRGFKTLDQRGFWTPEEKILMEKTFIKFSKGKLNMDGIKKLKWYIAHYVLHDSKTAKQVQKKSMIFTKPYEYFAPN